MLYSEHTPNSARLRLVRQISSSYLPTKAVWERIFALECGRKDSAGKQVLSAVYEPWRAIDGVLAASAWAGWLADHGDGKQAMKIIGGAMAQLDMEQRVQLSQAWSSRLEETNEEDGDSAADDKEMPLTLVVD